MPLLVKDLTIEQFQHLVAETFNTEIKKAGVVLTVQNSAIPKMKLAEICGVTYKTIAKWLEEDNLESVTYNDVEDFKRRHRKYAKKKPIYQ